MGRISSILMLQTGKEEKHMSKKAIVYLCASFAVCLALTAAANAAEEQKGSCQVKNFWQKLFNYPACVAKESVNTAAETAKRGTNVVVNEVKTVGQVTSGDVQKTGDLVTEPV